MVSYRMNRGPVFKNVWKGYYLILSGYDKVIFHLILYAGCIIDLGGEMTPLLDKEWLAFLYTRELKTV